MTKLVIPKGSLVRWDSTGHPHVFTCTEAVMGDIVLPVPIASARIAHEWRERRLGVSIPKWEYCFISSDLWDNLAAGRLALDQCEIKEE